jgi:leucyl-tRNA synthetase
MDTSKDSSENGANAATGAGNQGSTDKPERPRYTPAEIEPGWQKRWDDEHAFRAVRHPGKPKAYILDMFPYPSGAGLHVGHPLGYTATDILSRYKRMQGFDVLHPMGWDAFGLPAEQHAVKTGVHPSITTRQNIDTFRRQLKSLGFSYDWERELATTDPEYVRWTQWIFLQLFHRGLAYQANTPVNWCAGLGTVLANEEVIDGKSERGGFPVERLPLRQWMLKITAYADRLAADLEGLDWPETKAKQIDWIGRSEGAEIDFAIDGTNEHFTVFTTRPDTLFGSTYCVLAPEHALVPTIASAEQKAKVDEYRTTVGNKSDRDRLQNKQKTGVFTGAYAIHPLSGEKLPIWIADFVLGGYGTGAIMSVPGHDDRDFEFAKLMGLPIREVVTAAKGAAREDANTWETARVGEGFAIGSDFLDGLPTAEAKSKMIAELVQRNLGKAKITYKLRDWVFSRQRYWGEPFPIYFPVDLAEGSKDPRTDEHTIRYDQPIPVPEEELPLRLPVLEDYKPGNDPAGALARAVDWRYFQKDGVWFARETNTMPNWAGSCWYYLRFLDPKNDDEAWSQAAYDDWMPVDLYVGGSEHAVLHLLYARFWHKVLFDEGKVSHPEPFQRLVHQGLILGEDGQKMSKSIGNVVNPDDIVKAYGADALRCYEMFMGPLEQMKPWQTNGVVGVKRFLDRAFTATAFAANGAVSGIDAETNKLLHKTIKKLTEDIEAHQLNTCISTLMILVNRFVEVGGTSIETAKTFATLLSPFAPHLAEEIWARAGETTLVCHTSWPTFDPALVVDDTVEIGVQVNGKVRSRVTLSPTATEAEARAAIASDEAVQKHAAGKTEKKFLYVPGKIINLVVA